MLPSYHDMEKLISNYKVHGKPVLLSDKEEQEAQKQEEKVRRQIVRLYNQLDSSKPNVSLVYQSLLNSSSRFVKMAAIDVLKRLRTTSSIKNLFYALEEEDDEQVRKEIANALFYLEKQNSSYGTIGS